MTTVDAEAGRLKGEADEPGWEVDPDDEWGVAVVTTVGRQLKLRREAVGMRAAESGRVVGYGEDTVYKIEGGKRIPRREYLDKADEVLGAGGLIAAAWEDVEKVRYPRSVRALAGLEARAVELGVYVGLGIHGLLQTPEHARALFETTADPRTAVWDDPSAGPHPAGVAGLRRASAGRNMIRSSHSDGPDGNSCVELALTPGTVHVRDSKDTAGPRPAFAPDAWARFVPYASGG
ncbi:hypothetical protein GCM10010266_54070 [Streptomyces griseomycini]|uniref:Scr1 family TA system antitoxin-like transcriptional regulator n=1 Tax=Streptomyces griseomycini TaxID=66895 RepID=UPI00199B7456|nr:hypothetical protein GCM10010266_54070 [Streptomyces griseomycini]